MNILATETIDLGDDCTYVLELLQYPDGRFLVYSRIEHVDLGMPAEALAARRIFPAGRCDEAALHFGRCFDRMRRSNEGEYV